MRVNSAKLLLPDHRWETGVHVDLGAGRFPRNPLRCAQVVGVDILPEPPFTSSESVRYVRTSPGETLSITSQTVDSVSAYDFLEHLPRFAFRSDGSSANLFIEMMNEVHRILRPGGLFLALTPCYPADSTFVDPTHVNHIAVGTIDYFSGPTHARALGYGFEGAFSCVAQGWIRASDPIWSTQEPLMRDLSVPWLRPHPMPPLQRIRRVVSETSRTLRLRAPEQPPHYLWLLQRADC